MGCRNNRKDAIETICKGVKSTEKTCRSAVGISGRSTEYIPTKEELIKENDNQIDISTIDLLKNSMVWREKISIAFLCLKIVTLL